MTTENNQNSDKTIHQVYLLQFYTTETLTEFKEIVESTVLFFKEKIDENAKGFLFEEFSSHNCHLSKTNNISLSSKNSTEIIERIYKENEVYPGNNCFFISFLLPVDKFMDPFLSNCNGLEDLWENMFRELSSITNTIIDIYAYHSEFSDIIKQTYDSGDFDTGMISSKLSDFEDSPESDYLKSEQPVESFPMDEIFELSTYNK